MSRGRGRWSCWVGHPDADRRAGEEHDSFTGLGLSDWLAATARAEGCPTCCPILLDVRKTSVYLNDEQAERLSRLARQEGRPQAEILRAAIAAYQSPPSRDREFALAAGFPRIDADARPISQIPEHELLDGFGA
jgi:predicted transcriptional regulator